MHGRQRGRRGKLELSLVHPVDPTPRARSEILRALDSRSLVGELRGGNRASSPAGPAESRRPRLRGDRHDPPSSTYPDPDHQRLATARVSGWRRASTRWSRTSAFRDAANACASCPVGHNPTRRPERASVTISDASVRQSYRGVVAARSRAHPCRIGLAPPPAKTCR
jgi:hypothetical protein